MHLTALLFLTFQIQLIQTARVSQNAFAGNYGIINCNNEQTVLLHTLLVELSTALDPAIEDAQAIGHGNPQSAAFTAFFKDSNRAINVTSILANVKMGQIAWPADAYSRGAPVLTCLTEADRGKLTITYQKTGKIVDAWDALCSDLKATSTAAIGTKFIIFCPNYFNSPLVLASPPAPPKSNAPASNCLSITRNGKRFRGTAQDWSGGTPLLQFRVWILLQEIVHHYVQATWGAHAFDAEGEVYDANAAFALKASDSVLNGPNYCYYVASLWGKCTVFPSRADEGRELLDVGVDIAVNQPVNGTDPGFSAVTNVTIDFTKPV